MECPYCKKPAIKRIKVKDHPYLENQFAYLHETFHESRSYCVKPKRRKK